MKETGYVLFEDRSASRVVIATLESDNRKTGNMVQVWILCSDVDPVTAVRTGQDSRICGNCGLRGNGFKGRACYVTVAQGPNAVYRAYRAGKYPFLPATNASYSRVFVGRAIRFGAYGDPIHVPVEIMRLMVLFGAKTTGYTHQWRTCPVAYREYLMASCDSALDYAIATARGWRTFRVRPAGFPMLPGEIMCPASDEMGHRTTCERCGLCNGSKYAESRKNIAIVAHGMGKNNLIQLEVK